MADYSQLMSLERKAKTPPVVQQNTSTILLANQQTSKEVNQQVSLRENQQTNKPVNKLASKSANQQTSKLAEKSTTKTKKKYGTYLKEESIAAIQMLAIQTKRKDHEVLQEIVDTYFASKPAN